MTLVRLQNIALYDTRYFRVVTDSKIFGKIVKKQHITSKKFNEVPFFDHRPVNVGLKRNGVKSDRRYDYRWLENHRRKLFRFAKDQCYSSHKRSSTEIFATFQQIQCQTLYRCMYYSLYCLATNT